MRHWVVAGSGLLISMLENLSRFCLTSLIILLKMDGSVLAEKSSLRCRGCLSLLNYIIFIAKTASKKIGDLLCVSINLPYGLAQYC